MARRLTGLKREQASLARRIAKTELAEMRAAVARAKQAKRARLVAVSAAIASARERLKGRVARFRGQWRDWVNARVDEMRADAQRRYNKARSKARAKGTTAVQRAEGELAARRLLEQRISAAADWRRDQRQRGHRSTFVARAESDDQVRANLPPELLPVWERFKNRVKTRVPGKSRTEAFMEWVEENEDEIVSAMGDIAERQARETFERGESEAEYQERLKREQRRQPKKAAAWEYEALDEAIPF